MKKFLLPLMLVFLFLLESLFVQFLPAKFLGGSNIIVPHFLYTALLFLTIYIGRKQGIIYSAIFGLLFDIVFVEIIGIYFFLFPFIAYLVSKLMRILQANIVVVFLVTLSGIALLEIGVYEMNYLIHVTNLDFMSYLKIRFYPTLLLNAAFIIFAAYPLKRQFEKHAEALRDE